MDCPFCGHDATKVLDTRLCRGDRVRKRRCAGCGGRFSTAERITVEYLKVRKRDGRVEPFSRAKLRAGVRQAALGTGLTVDDVDRVVARVLEILQPEAPDIPVPGKEIGDLVLDQLRGGGPESDVALARYAMVFLGGTKYSRGFRGLEDLLEWLEQTYGPPRVDVSGSTPRAVVKRDGRVEPFHVGKVTAGVVRAAKGRGSASVVDKLAWVATRRVVDELRGQALVTSQQVAAEVLRVLRDQDAVAYLRYAAAVKRYRSVGDLWMDALALRDAR
ncbi:ATP cone domain-containing protein [Actinosynnema sp. NPDC020468]|uniref:ATP cone domain-containing protein n=1 Tax=Actinosynnema sp. NPDC020468 TaxID=3154488 RepID=UPI0033D0DC0A